MAAQSRPLVKVGLSVLQYSALSALASSVVSQMTTNIASFPTPNPTLASITAQNAILISAIAAWGPVGNRGSHADLVALRAAAVLMKQLLTQEAAYVQNLVVQSDPYADQVAFIISSGFAVKNVPAPQGLLNPPENLHIVISSTFPSTAPKVAWRKPLGVTSKNNVKTYYVFISLMNAKPDVAIAASSRTSIVLSPGNVFSGVSIPPNTYYVWVTAFNDAGQGAPAGSIVMVVTPV